MIEITPGWLMVGGSVLGIIGSVTGLIITGKIFRKQRRNILEQIANS